jgi:N-sulfoglucosamine sulfohydrolase
MRASALLPLLFLGIATGGHAKPNVLLITADDMGLQLGCYGDPVIRTPHLDALASKGRLFENAYVAQASCSPSRSAMFTGTYPHTNGQYGLLNANVGFELHARMRAQTIPALLKKAGYRTGILGKLHVGPESSFPFDFRERIDTRDVRSTAKQAAVFLNEESEQPFFLMMNYSDPHVMGKSTPDRKEAFPTQYKGVPEKPLTIGEVPPLPFQDLEAPAQIERTTQYYNACMRFDAAVGLLLAELEAAGHADDTLILFVSDHGPPFFRGKTSCYEGGVHVPMIAVWPGVFGAGERTGALVSTIDLLPTILDAVGEPVPEGVQGVSLRATSDAETHREFLATEFHYHGYKPFFPRRSIRDERFKLIHNLRAGEVEPPSRIDGDPALSLSRASAHKDTPVGRAYEVAANPPEFELYDLESDPWEFHNLAAEVEHTTTLRRMQGALMEWRQQTQDPLLDPSAWTEVAKFESRTPRKK